MVTLYFMNIFGTISLTHLPAPNRKFLCVSEPLTPSSINDEINVYSQKSIWIVYTQYYISNIMVILSRNRYHVSNHCAIEKQRAYPLFPLRYNFEAHALPPIIFKLRFEQGKHFKNKDF